MTFKTDKGYYQLLRHPFKKIAVFSLFVISVTAALTYGKWEVLTLLHGKEFNNIITFDEKSNTEAMISEHPKFIKVISYSNDNANLLWVSEGDRLHPSDYHQEVTFKKQTNSSGQTFWAVKSWAICTPANGSPTAYFPYYGGVQEASPSALLEAIVRSII
jgi:hypothetical protein